MICSDLFMWNVLSLLRGSRHGIFFVSFRYSWALRLSLWSHVLFGTSPVRLSSSCLWPQLAVWANSKLCLLRSVLPLGVTSFLSYLSEFRAKSESASNPLPRSFRVRSLRDFVGSLPSEMSLCPVCALQIYLRRT